MDEGEDDDEDEGDEKDEDEDEDEETVNKDEKRYKLLTRSSMYYTVP